MRRRHALAGTAFPVILSIILFSLSGCTIINFGVGVAIDGPGKEMHYSPYQPSIYPVHHHGRYEIRIHTDSGVKKVYTANGIFIRDGQSDRSWHISGATVAARLSGGEEVSGYVTHAGSDEGDAFLRFDEERDLALEEIEELRFYATRGDTLHNQWGTYSVVGEVDSTQTTLRRGQISEVYLGFDFYEWNMDPYLVDVTEIEKIEHRRKMGMAPWGLAGAGLAVDLIAGLLILIL